MKGYRGYISGGTINGNLIPQRIQNLTLKSYAEKNQLSLLMAAAEYNFNHSTIILNGIFEEANNVDGFIFYSIWQIPPLPNVHKKIQELIENHKLTFHFALENKTVNTLSEWILLEDYFMIKELSLRTPNIINKIFS